MNISSEEENLFKCITSSILKNKDLEGMLNAFDEVWSQLWNKEEIEKRKNLLKDAIINNVTETVRTNLEAEEATKESYVVRLEELMALSYELKQNLNVEIEHDDLTNLPFHDIAIIMSKRIEKYKNVRDERLRQLSELKQQEKALCDNLDFIPADIKFNKIPSEDQLKLLSNHVKHLREEEITRKCQLAEDRTVIKRMYSELGTNPLLNSEKELLNDEHLKPTLENLAQLANLKKNVEETVLEAKENVAELKRKLANLWKYLDYDENKIEDFLKEVDGFSVTVIDKLKSEMDRLEKVKRENVKEIVARMKNILIEEWDKVFFSEEERAKFRHFDNECFNEDLCLLFEMQINEVQTFYLKNEKLFALIKKHQTLMNNYKNLMDTRKDANRYKNRGGQLLQEEKERRKLQKEVPKVEEELRALLLQYLETEGKDFTYFGVPMLKMNNFWLDTSGVKSNSKQLTKSGQKRPNTTTVNGGTSDKRGRYTPGSRILTKPPRPDENRRPARKQLEYEQFEKSLNSKATLRIRSSSVSDLSKTPRIVVDLFQTPTKKSTFKTPQGTPARLRTPRTAPYALRRSNTMNTPNTCKSNSRAAPLSTTKVNKLPFLI